ncbi:MAG: BolA family transcriptional regulator [Burkholderiales bacterium]|nr:BolA family transcriptional regulator [Burkholderiales bacterium]
MPETVIDRMRSKLATLEPLAIELRDDSASHAGHAGAASGGGHYQLRLVSARFAGQSKIARHRLVYDLLSDLMQREIHALAMNLLAPDEVERAPFSDPNPGPPNADFSPNHPSGH